MTISNKKPTQLVAPKAPRLPSPTDDYSAETVDQLNANLRTYFQQIDNTNSALLGPSGARFLDFPFGIFHQAANQTAPDTTTINATLFSVTQSSIGVDMVTTSEIQVQFPGLYTFSFLLQLRNVDAAARDVHFWLRKNGVDVENTAHRVTVPIGYLRQALDFNLTLEPSDKIQLMWLASDTDVSLAFTAAVTGPPAIPAIPSSYVAVQYMSAVNSLNTDVFTPPAPPPPPPGPTPPPPPGPTPPAPPPDIPGEDSDIDAIFATETGAWWYPADNDDRIANADGTGGIVTTHNARVGRLLDHGGDGQHLSWSSGVNDRPTYENTGTGPATWLDNERLNVFAAPAACAGLGGSTTGFCAVFTVRFGSGTGATLFSDVSAPAATSTAGMYLRYNPTTTTVTYSVGNGSSRDSVSVTGVLQGAAAPPYTFLVWYDDAANTINIRMNGDSPVSAPCTNVSAGSSAMQVFSNPSADTSLGSLDGLDRFFGHFFGGAIIEGDCLTAAQRDDLMAWAVLQGDVDTTPRSIIIPLTGHQMTAARGTMGIVVAADVTIALTGRQLTVSRGTMTVGSTTPPPPPPPPPSPMPSITNVSSHPYDWLDIGNYMIEDNRPGAGGITAPGGGGGADGFPDRILAIYYEAYLGGANPSIVQVPTTFNVIYLFHCKFNADGSPRWEHASTTPSSQIQTVRGRGQKVILTVGGAANHFTFTNRTQSTAFVNGFINIATNIMGGIDGCDFNNYEQQPPSQTFINEMVWISQQLKAQYGPNFAITTPSQPNSTTDRELARQMHLNGVLTWAGPQYYDWSGFKADNFITTRNNDWVGSIGARKVLLGLGAGNYNTANATTLAESTREWDRCVANHPGQRGVFAWSAIHNHNNGNAFGNTFSTRLNSLGDGGTGSGSGSGTTTGVITEGPATTQYAQAVERSLTVGSSGEVAWRTTWRWPTTDANGVDIATSPSYRQIKGFPTIIHGNKPGYSGTTNDGGTVTFYPALDRVVRAPDNVQVPTAPVGAPTAVANNWKQPGGSVVTTTPAGSTGGPLPVALSIFTGGTGRVSFRYQYGTSNTPPTGFGQLVLVIWLQENSTQRLGFVNSPVTHEIRIPIACWGGFGAPHTDTVAPANFRRPSSMYAHDATVNGTTYKFYAFPGTNGELSYTFGAGGLNGSFTNEETGQPRTGWKRIEAIVPDLRTANHPSANGLTTVDFGAIIEHIKTRTDARGFRWVRGTEFLVSMELGVEQVTGTGDVTVWDYDVEVSTAPPPGPPPPPPPGTTVNYPFGSRLDLSGGAYPFGIKPTNLTASEMDTRVQNCYLLWKNAMVRKSPTFTAASQSIFGAVPITDAYHIRFGNSTTDACRSEGTGYGMLIMVVMAGFDPEAKTIFDGLYRLVRARPAYAEALVNAQYLMEWRLAINTMASLGDGFNALDGDMDIALALLMADRQWGSGGAINYRQQAINTINAMKAVNFNANGLPYYAFQQVSRTSDYMPGHFREYFAATADSFWTTARTRCDTAIADIIADFSATAKLTPDFIDQPLSTATAVPSPGNQIEGPYEGRYAYNAQRNPWRWGTDFVWSGDSAWGTYAADIATTIKTRQGNNPFSTALEYNLNGTEFGPERFFNEVVNGPLMVGCMCSASHQAYLDTLFIANTDNFSVDHYESELQLIPLLVASGNWWNP